MSGALWWFFSQLREDRKTLHSSMAPSDLLTKVALRVTPRPPWQDEALASLSSKSDFLPEDTFTTFMADFNVRGDLAMGSRGLWGRVGITDVWFEVATGYGARRRWIPRLIGDVVLANDGGSTISYRVRMMQYSQVVAWIVGLTLGALFVGIGLALLLTDATVEGGIVTLAVGAAVLVTMMSRSKRSRHVAQRMANYLEETIEQFAKG
ncbi:MAG TPA: hypothetical protein VGZ04_07515 [Acidimicrobiales bacterium]|jgi:hypothetical protein|nr:hypothetical protein [Acidimicrobiales bacterium]